jgi:hypothetical protein
MNNFAKGACKQYQDAGNFATLSAAFRVLPVSATRLNMQRVLAGRPNKGDPLIMAKNKSVLGIYATRNGVENAVQAFKDGGFSSSDVSVLLPENLGSKEIGTDKATKAPEGAATGGTSGAVIGGALGWLVGIGALAIPGVGPFIAAGPIVAALAGLGVGGAVGGVTGALIGLGIPEYEAKRYEGRVQKGGILVSVHCDTSDEISKAKKIMENTGGEDISSTSESSADVKTNDPARRAAGSY